MSVIQREELTYVPVFSEAQRMPCMHADLVTGDGNWTRTNVKAILNASVHQSHRDKVPSTAMLVIVQNQAWTNACMNRNTQPDIFTAVSSINSNTAIYFIQTARPRPKSKLKKYQSNVQQ